MAREITFEDISFQNFLSFGNQLFTVKLNEPGITVIIGENLDVAEDERNGVGKSAIIDALAYCLFGSAIRDLPNAELTNWNTKKRMLVIVHFSTEGFQYRVERGENPGFLRLFKRPIGTTESWTTQNEQGDYIYDISRTKPETTKKIVDVLGFDLKLFEIIALNSSQSKSFFDQKEDKRREIIELLCGFTVLSARAEYLKDPIRKEANKKLVALESAFEATRQANARIQKEIDRLEEQSIEWEKQIARDRLQARTLMERLAKIDFDAEIEKIKTKKEVEQKLLAAQTARSAAQAEFVSLTKQADAWTRAHQGRLKAIQDEIAVIANTNPEEDAKIIILRSDHAAKQTGIETRWAKAQSGLKEVEARLKASETLFNTAVQTQMRLEGERDAMEGNTCPTCGQTWTDHADRIAHLNEEITKAFAVVTAHKADVDREREVLPIAQKHAAETKAELAEYDRATAALPPHPKAFLTLADALSAKARLVELHGRVDSINAETNPYISNIEAAKATYDLAEAEYVALGNLSTEADLMPTAYPTVEQAIAARTQYDGAVQAVREYDTAVNPYTESIQRLKTEAQKRINDQEIRDLKKKIEHYNFLIEMLTSKDSFLRQQILMRWIPKMNERMRYYMDRLEHPYVVEFQPDMTASIFTRSGKPAKYAGTSRGQQTRIWLSTNWTFHDVFEMLHTRINILFIDELLDNGMSERGAERCYEIVDDLAHRRGKSIFIITHRQDLADRAENVLRVQMQYENAKIVQGNA